MTDATTRPRSYGPPTMAPFPRFIDFPLIRHRQIRCKCKGQFNPRVRFGTKDDDVPVECKNCGTLLYLLYSVDADRFVVAEVSDEDLEYMQSERMNERRQLIYLLTTPVRTIAAA